MGWRSVWLCFLVLPLIEVQARLVRNHVSTICSTWGSQHFKTFDGDVFQFPGMCEYNLVSDCRSAFQEFSVHMRRKENHGSPTVSHVVVTINELSVHLSKTVVTVDDIPIKLPYHIKGVQVEQNAVYIKLQSSVGIVVMWNRDDAVMVELDNDYANHTCGLCGDFNGIPIHNEFISKGRQVSPIEFGNYHRVYLPNDECEDPSEEDEEPLTNTVPESCQEFQSTCDKQLRSESWSSCSQLINPQHYIQACVLDMCSCTSNSSASCVCNTLSEFSRQCSHAGGQPPNWRNTQFCAKQCPYNMVYEESGSPCVDTCTHLDTSSLCEDHKMDGCFCPPGTVFDDISLRGCIAQSECKCKHDKIYNSGEVYRQDTKECICFEGRWNCKSLQTPVTCAVEEGSHITTFDGKTFTFHGDCYYTLAKVESKDAASPKFSILAQLVPCGHQKFDTCLKNIKMVLNSDRNNVLMFTSDGSVKQNSQIISLPYQSSDINIFRASSFHILVQTTFGLRIQIQHVPVMQVYVTLDHSYKAKTRGLCGNFNMVLSDDMRTPQGIVEGTAAPFCNAWKTSLTCQDRAERLDDPCSLSLENENYGKHWCALLLSPNSTFTRCHSVVNPEPYYKRCMYASCNCAKSEACLCAVFSSYARACSSKGVFLINWRDKVCHRYTESCPATQVYSYKLQRCQQTCMSLGSSAHSCSTDFLPVDGCSCPEGLHLNEHDLCVPMAKCPCFHDEVFVKAGKSISVKDEHCVCTNGTLHCHSWKEMKSATCPHPKVYFNCSTSGTGELRHQCAQTCLNLDIDECDAADCKSGCQCPAGLLDDGLGSCVRESECTCQHDGNIYATGSKIVNECNNCTCRSGSWQCTEAKCPGTCTIYGSGHYNTFDMIAYGFQGHCAYVAVKNKCGNKTVHENFGVITENVPCGTTGTTCSKIVRIQLGRNEIKLSKGNYTEEDLGHGPDVQYRIRRVGLYLVLESAVGLAVMWDRKTTVRILLEPQHSGEVCGLCGDFDGDGQNDFTTQGQLIVSNPVDFANSWKVSSSCPDVENSTDPCVMRPNRHHWAKRMCSIITGETFKDCHSKVDNRPFYENCVKDSCACDSGGDCECFCTAVAAYAQACNEAGVCVKWRTPDLCPVFCDYYNNEEECKWHYYPCHTPCFKTCLNPEGTCTSPIPNLEGCYPVCPEETPIFDEETQMCVEECSGCFYNGTRYEENEVIYNVTDNLGMCYYAICINQTVIQGSEPCHSTPMPPTPSTTPTTPKTMTTTGSSTLTPLYTSTTEAPTITTSITTETSSPTHVTTTEGPTTTSESAKTSTQSQTPTVSTTPCIVQCEWSEWYNVHNPMEDKSDRETYENIIEHGGKICKNPKEIDCRASDYPDMEFEDFITETKQVVSCDLGSGLLCRYEDQPIGRKCHDYKIKVCCVTVDCSPTTTTSPTTPPSSPTTFTTTTPTQTPSTQPPSPTTTSITTTPVQTSPTTQPSSPTTFTTTTPTQTPSTQPPSPTTTSITTTPVQTSPTTPPSSPTTLATTTPIQTSSTKPQSPTPTPHQTSPTTPPSSPTTFTTTTPTQTPSTQPPSPTPTPHQTSPTTTPSSPTTLATTTPIQTSSTKSPSPTTTSITATPVHTSPTTPPSSPTTFTTTTPTQTPSTQPPSPTTTSITTTPVQTSPTTQPSSMTTTGSSTLTPLYTSTTEAPTITTRTNNNLRICENFNTESNPYSFYNTMHCAM
ncbi:mucin-2-like [Nelusetta ayraudi]|uniref:mucin-2-like n=1 Tax=Nelusetta ayraudi TaxID=303726 RepID=UPI003F712463